MVRLEKGAQPDVLVRHGQQWTDELLRRINAGEVISEYLLSRYSHPQIKAALIAETSGKCAYCESPFTHIAFGDVEHIVPKSIDARLRFAWANLTVACDVCNQNKSNHLGIVDPYVSDPIDMFEYFGPLMWAALGNDVAQLTEELIDLNRPGLVERRRERLEYIRRLVDSALTKPVAVRDAMLERAWREVEQTRPFSACARAMLGKLLA